MARSDLCYGPVLIFKLEAGMAHEIEKNDVDISKLFLWNTEVEIKDDTGKVLKTVWMRLIGDADLNRARVISLRESSKIREALKTETSDEYMAYIAPLKFSEKGNIVAGIKLLSMSDYMDEARTSVITKFPVEPPSDASLEEQEKYQKSVDEFPLKWDKDLNKELKKIDKREEARLIELDFEALKKEYIDMLINYICQSIMNSTFHSYCTYFGTYEDNKFRRRVFRSYDDYSNISPKTKQKLEEAYKELEISVPELKKSQGATP